MTKAEMISTLAEKNELTKAQTEGVFNSIFDMFKDELAKGNDVAISGFGSFKSVTMTVSRRAKSTTGVISILRDESYSTTIIFVIVPTGISAT